jgi:hypothetical protein
MSRGQASRCSVWGGVFLLCAGTALAATDEVPNTLDIRDDCPVFETCVDQYLWSLYERTPKVDTVKVSEKRRVTVKRKGKTRTATRTVTRLMDEDFTWKDLKAAQRVGLTPMAYVIGGLSRSFRLTLYRALRALDDAGLAPGITSAFRDDYRQSIASGNKARSDRSFHGGSSRGGYGHGLAVDLVSVKGATRGQRWRTSEQLWNWIDAHGKEFGIGRPYLDRDAPHVAPIDGKEYAAHHGAAKTRHAAAAKKKNHRLARHNARGTKRGKTVSSSKIHRRAESMPAVGIVILSARAETGQIHHAGTAIRSAAATELRAGGS